MKKLFHIWLVYIIYIIIINKILNTIYYYYYRRSLRANSKILFKPRSISEYKRGKKKFPQNIDFFL